MRLHALFALVALIALALVPQPVGAQCNIPLFVRQSGGDANLMILVDNSGSMNEASLHPDYDPDHQYSGVFDPYRTYYIASDGYRRLSNFNSSWSIYGSHTAYLVDSDRDEDGRYFGNYLNWIYFHATAEQRAAIPRNTRIQVTKLVLKDIINRTQNIRMGMTVFQYSGPGNIISRLGTSKATLLSNLNNLAANCWTPLAESMETILNYFKDASANGAITSWCQRNFLVVMTDGLPTYDTNISPYLWDADGDGLDPGSCASIGAPYPEDQLCSHHMDDVAYYMHHNDLRTDLQGEQEVTTYVIGFNVDSPLLESTAANGGGRYYTAKNAAGLVYAFNSAIYDILMRISSGSAVAVISTERGEEDRLIRGKFMPGSWEGFLESFAVPYHEGDQPVWEAGRLLEVRNPDSRNIFTALGTTVYDFSTDNADALVAAMNCPNADTAASVIRWTRGERVEWMRPRGDWKLGDIVSSTPVVVGAPRSFFPNPDHQAFLAAYAARTKMIYVGANDGMLHAFWAETGEEAWAFVPEFALPKLWTMTDSLYCHTYTCDQTISAADVKLGGAWRTVVAAGGREGGASYFALDVTDPTSPDLLWQVTLPDGAAFSSEVEFATVAGRNVALIGSGLDTNLAKSWLHVYDVETGALQGSVMLTDIATRNKTTRPRAVDLDLDGSTDVVYVADMSGKVYRFAVNGLNPAGWSRSTLFNGTVPVTATPTPVHGEGGEILLFFGTGAYLAESDFTTTTQNYFYCVADRHSGSTVSPSDLRNQTSTIHDMGTAPGWYVALWNGSGERVTEQTVVVAQTAYFTSYAPNTVVCGVGGHSWLYQLRWDDGGNPLNEEDGELPRCIDLGEGIAARPVADIVNETITVQSSDASIEVHDIGPMYFPLNVRSWQENFDFIGAGMQGD